MGSQFIHADSYGRQAGKGKRSGNTIASIVGEAERDEGQCYHIEEPQKPVVLFGSSFREAGIEAEKWAEPMKDARGHKLRKDALCMVAGVVSAPDDLKDWDKYKKDAVKWLVKKYGKCLKSVVEHTDESHRHFHFAVVAKKGERFETIHQGYAAQREADPLRGDRKRTTEEKSSGRRQGIHAYQTAMRDYQDEFYEAVSKKHGLTRIGPGRRRLSRGEWKQEQEEARKIAATIARNERAEEALRERFTEVVGREKAVQEAEKLNSKTTGDFLRKQFTALNQEQINQCWAVLQAKANEFRTTPKQTVTERKNEREQDRGKGR